MTLNTRKLPTTYRRITHVKVRAVDGPDKGLSVDIAADPDGSRVIRGGRNKVNRIVLTDDSVSDIHFELQLREKGVLLKDLGSLNGILVYGLRVQEAWIEPNTVFRVGKSALELVAAEPHEVELSPVDRLDDLYGRCELMRELFVKIGRLATRGEKIRILVTGETGTGKELVARALHNRSPRAAKPFVAINCATLTPSLAAATLFGHDRGAFTDAHQARPGCFEQADGGTLFLDEIAEMPLEIQSAFLRVLQEGKVCRVGEFKERPVNVRVICATHRDLSSLVAQKQFREDLFYRLSDLSIELPPLRERGDDLMYLAEHFVHDFSEPGMPQRQFSREAQELLRSHTWPGNVRELASVIRTACVISDGGEIQRSDLSIARTLRQARGAVSEDLLHLPYKDALTAFQKIYFGRLNQLFNGSLTKISGSAKMTIEGVRQALIRLGLRGGDTAV